MFNQAFAKRWKSVCLADPCINPGRCISRFNCHSSPSYHHVKATIRTKSWSSRVFMCLIRLITYDMPLLPTPWANFYVMWSLSSTFQKSGARSIFEYKRRTPKFVNPRGSVVLNNSNVRDEDRSPCGKSVVIFFGLSLHFSGPESKTTRNNQTFWNDTDIPRYLCIAVQLTNKISAVYNRFTYEMRRVAQPRCILLRL